MRAGLPEILTPPPTSWNSEANTDTSLQSVTQWMPNEPAHYTTVVTLNIAVATEHRKIGQWGELHCGGRPRKEMGSTGITPSRISYKQT